VLKKFVTFATAGVAMLATVSVAQAQTPPEPVIQVTGSISPDSGGTKKKPKNGSLDVAFTVNKESKKTVSTITYMVPRDVKLSGKGFRYCPASKINAQGEEKCPKGSKVGEGTATAVLGPNAAPLSFTVNVYAGSKDELALALAQTGGGAVRTAFAGPITSAGSPFGQKITVAVPESVQSPAANLYSYITSVDTTITGKTTKTKTVKKKGKKRKVKTKYYFASVTGCPADGTHDLGVQLTYAQNDSGPAGQSAVVQDTSDCTK
jgi:hypothetical protein